MAANGFIHGRPGTMTELAGQLDPQPVRDGATAAGSAHASAVDCAMRLPGCERFNAQVRTTAEKFTAFFAEAEEGLRAFTSVGQVSATDYAGQDADTTATFAPMATTRTGRVAAL
jgi:hypothetical protein